MPSENSIITPTPNTPSPAAGAIFENQNIDQDRGNELTLKQQTDSNTEEIKKIRQDLANERLNNITIFGIFASLVTFFSIEIQVFKNIDNFWLIVGLTAFLVSSLLLFVFSIHSIAREKLGWRDFFSTPVFWLFMVFLIFSLVIFVLNSKGINIDLHIES
jgi:hypothetical protein